MKRIYKSGATKFLKNRLKKKTRDVGLSLIGWKELLDNKNLVENVVNDFCIKYKLQKNKKFELEGRGQFGYHPIYEDMPISFVKHTIIMFY